MESFVALGQSVYQQIRKFESRFSLGFSSYDIIFKTKVKIILEKNI